jgi:hypothetical protein
MRPPVALVSLSGGMVTGRPRVHRALLASHERSHTLPQSKEAGSTLGDVSSTGRPSPQRKCLILV